MFNESSLELAIGAVQQRYSLLIQVKVLQRRLSQCLDTRGTNDSGLRFDNESAVNGMPNFTLF